MDAWNPPERITPGADEHAVPVRPGNALPRAPVIVGALQPARFVACDSCATDVPAQRYCCSCGAQLVPTACRCGVELPAGACYCAACGTPVSGA